MMKTDIRIRNKMITTGIIVILLLVGFELGAQEIYGEWKNSQYKISMILNRDGTYTFNGPYGTSTGKWGVQGRTFWMQDTSNRVVYYNIQFHSASRLNLVDVKGVPLNYVRKIPVQTVDSGILMEKRGLKLTALHINTGVGIIQFIIGQSIKKSEIEELTAASIKEFPVNPQEWLRQMNSLEQSLQKLRQLHDPLKIGAARQMLFSEFYRATLKFKEEDKPLLIQIINRYIKVLAYDKANKLVLTNHDAVAMISYIEFSNKIYGLERKFTPAERSQFTKELINKFSSLPLDQRKFLCSASLAWNLVKANWQKFTANKQIAIQNRFVNNQVDQCGLKKIPGYPYNGTREEKRAALRRMRRQYMAKQNMFQMMNNTSLGNHAMMMNTIENFGGTGKYWEVVDY